MVSVSVSVIALIALMTIAIAPVNGEKVSIKINTASDAPSGTTTTSSWSYNGGATTATTTITNTPATPAAVPVSQSSFPPQTPTLFREVAAINLPSLHGIYHVLNHMRPCCLFVCLYYYLSMTRCLFRLLYINE
jgi:hypothetical protein